MKEHDRQLSCSFCYTLNNSSEMGKVIGKIWRKFLGENGYARIPGKMNQKALRIYTDYASEVNGDYTVISMILKNIRIRMWRMHKYIYWGIIRIDSK